MKATAQPWPLLAGKSLFIESNFGRLFRLLNPDGIRENYFNTTSIFVHVSRIAFVTGVRVAYMHMRPVKESKRTYATLTPLLDCLFLF